MFRDQAHRQETKDVQNEHQVLEHGHSTASVNIGEQDEDGDGPDAERALPIRAGVAFVILGGQRLDHGTNEEWTTGSSGLPTQSRHPAGEVG